MSTATATRTGSATAIATIPSLTVIVVNYNGAATVRRCLRALWEQREPDWETILVDNASSDGSARGLAEDFSGLRVVFNTHNSGFAAANNLALRSISGRNVLLLNPDVVAEAGAIRTAVEYLEDNADVGIVGARVLLPGGHLDPAARRSFKTPGTYLYKWLGLCRRLPRHPRFGRYYLSYLDENQITDVDSVPGAFLLIRRAVVERIGLLDERFFMYCEDEDWCLRAKQGGWRVVYHPAVVVHHAKGSSTRQRRLRMAYHFHRSLILYHRKNIAPHHAKPLNATVYAGIGVGMLRAIAIALLRSGVARVASRWRAFRSKVA
jgi:GT2 family glycosyltransferase